MDHISELPDCILSYIMTMLSMKDMLKTSILSKRWHKLWTLRRDLHFDILNMFGSEDEVLQTGHLIEIPNKIHVDLDMTSDEFVKRVDQFVKNFQDTKIDSFLVNFFLHSEHSNTIDQWINIVIAKGVERVDLLLLGRPYVELTKCYKRCSFDLNLFLETNVSTLKHLSLEYCIMCPITKCDFNVFKNLKSLILIQTKVDEMFITNLLSNCQLLDELHLIWCDFKSSMPKIVSSSLCHFEVMQSHVLVGNVMKNINLTLLDCPKLTSLVYLDYDLEVIHINTPLLKSVHFAISDTKDLNAFALFANLPKLEILRMDVYTRVPTSLQIKWPLKHLKQLNIIFSAPLMFLDPIEFDLLGILTILKASPFLQNLSVTVTHAKLIEDQRDIKDVEICFHEEVRVIELGGCVGNWYEIEFVMNVLKYTRKLERIVLSPNWRDEELEDWNFDTVWFLNGRQRINEKLEDEKVVGREKVVLL